VTPTAVVFASISSGAVSRSSGSSSSADDGRFARTAVLESSERRPMRV
jgi:hypothetical protein